MPKAIRICKICGKEYPYCKTARNSDIFRWQDVACCPEHGSEYFAKVIESRKPKKTVAAAKADAPKKDTYTEPEEDLLDLYDEDEDEDEDDEDFEEEW